MAVQVTLEFTDAQWELVKEHYHCYKDAFDDNQEFIGLEPQTVTEEVVAARLKTLIEDEVVECMRTAEREAKITALDDAFKV